MWIRILNADFRRSLFILQLNKSCRGFVRSKVMESGTSAASMG